MQRHSTILEVVRLQHEIISVNQKDLGINTKLMSLKSQKEFRAITASKTFTLLPEFLSSLGITHFSTLPFHHSDTQNTAVEWVTTNKLKHPYHYNQEDVYKILDRTPLAQLEMIRSEYKRCIEIAKLPSNKSI
jgi:hypothetical protein